MFLLLLRKLWFRRPRSDTEKAPRPTPTAIESGSSEPEIQKAPQMPDITFTTAPHDETEIIVNQLALLAATVSHTSTTQQPSTSTQTATQQSPPPVNLPAEPEEEEETFYHLSSLITISCQPSHAPARSTSSQATKSARKSLVFDGKRASSILSLNIGDLPTLPFPRSKHRVPRKGPRYSPLPPPFVQKSLAMRPEVRF